MHLVCFLKSLSQCDEELRGTNTGHRIQVSANIKSHRPHRRVVAQAKPYGVGIVVYKTSEIDRAINVSSVIKQHATEIALDGQREPQLGVDNEELVAAYWHAYVGTGAGVVRIAAYGDVALGSGTIDGETAERGSAAGKETLAGRHVTAAI